jgi:hypothetical protein
MSTLKVDAIRHNSATSDAITTAADGTCTAKLTSVGGGQLSHRNLLINGDYRISQRATSSTSNGYQTMDRWYVYAANHSVTVTTAQVAITSGNAYDDGFRKAAKISLSGAGTLANNTEILIYQKIEATNLANSGWNYKSASSNITLSFWVKSSTAQAFAAHIRTEDGTAYLYSFTYTVAQANVWQKITKTIPGNSNITISDNNGSGLRVYVGVPAIGSDYTSGTADTWVVSSSSNKFPTVPNTWLTAGSSTFELTGVQLEVGDTATSFEHRSFGEELSLCYRYYYKLGKLDYISQHMSAGEQYCIGMSDNDDVNIYGMINFPVFMRTPPTGIDQAGSAGNYRVRRDTTQTCTGVPTFIDAAHHYCRVNFPKSSHGWGTGQMLWCQSGGSGSYLGFSAEL